MNTAPVVKDVLLVGGGHSHVLLIRMWAMQPIAGVRLTLVSEKVDTPYSGMLPGLIAGHYQPDDVHIDLARLCSWANVRFIEQRVTKIDLEAKCVSFAGDANKALGGSSTAARPPIHFDLLSLDTGSTPELSVDGSDTFSVPVKPVHGFYQRWLALLERVQRAPENTQGQQQSDSVAVGVVGSGAGGFELIMAMQYALSKLGANITCHWFVRGTRVLKGRPEKVSDMAIQSALDAGVVVHKEFDVINVDIHAVHSRDGRTVALDETVWCAAARAPDWPGEAGFEVDHRGFVLTNSYLQSISHNFVFATGDIGTQRDTPSDKAGVFAVRQAPVLFQNIRRLLLKTTLKPYKPQSDFLSLMATGKQSAIGNRGSVSVQGAHVWKLKDHIDQKFMNQFRRLPEMTTRSAVFKVPDALLQDGSLSSAEVSSSAMRCTGCGAKVGASILDAVLENLNSTQADGVVSGLAEAKDTAVFNVTAATIAQSVDQLSAVCSDPYVFGRIAAVHACSDVFTAGAKLHSAQVIASLPFAEQKIVERDLHQLMSGVVDALNEDDCALIGGHTAEAKDMALGLVVNGMLATPPPANEARPQEGDSLILTKPIGTGVLLAGLMQSKARGKDVQVMLGVMQQSNRKAAEALFQHATTAVTDITGFGLLGHLHRLLLPLQTGASLNLSTIPLYEGALALAEQGVSSTLLNKNQDVLSQVSDTEALTAEWRNLLCDPQTSGGLLGIVPASQCNTVLSTLKEELGYEQATVVGTITGQPTIRFSA